MGYINVLQKKVEALEGRSTQAQHLIQQFRQHLDIAKFKGVDQNGERKDWIATADVEAWLRNITAVLTTGDAHAVITVQEGYCTLLMESLIYGTVTMSQPYRDDFPEVAIKVLLERARKLGATSHEILNAV